MTQPRNRDVNRGGHPTQFTSRERRDPVMTLERREPADHTDIGRYFAGGTNDIIPAPWGHEDRWPPYAPDAWQRIDVVEMSPVGMMRTQRRLTKKGVEKHAQGGDADGGDQHPWIIRYRGENWVFDGHHRIANAVQNGDESIAVRLYDWDAAEH
jgi:hypothetical protein